MTRTRAALAGGLAGAFVSLALWSTDLVSLRSLSFAGVSDAAVQDRLLGVALPAVVSFELRLLLLQLAAGGLAGCLASLAVAGGARRRLAAGALTALTLHVLALLGMMGRYPQLYADRYWLAGGLRASVQRLATHVFGPAVFDGLFLIVLAGLLLAVALRERALWSRLPARVWALAAGALLLSLALSGSRLPEAPKVPAAGPPSVLLIVVDSLREDRLLSPEVMPAVSRLAGEGTLFRHAFTPVARTFPSWVSLLTGMEPRHTGVRTMFPDLESRQKLGPTFVSELRDAGYRTFVVSDFAGDMFPRIPGGFDDVDTPNLTAGSLTRATALAAHGFALPFLRIAPLREVLGEWRNLASLSDPEWLTDRTLAHMRRARGRPFVGAVFFGTPHFPYVAPYPDYLTGAGSYRGRYLYHAPPALGQSAPSPQDVAQVRARYDGAVRSTDRAIERLVGALRRDSTLDRTLVVITADHGEELYEEKGIAGHGDTIGAERSQLVPILLRGPGVEAGRVRSDQVRLYDVGATVLGLALGTKGRSFGDGLDLRVEGVLRPACLETGIWFFPGLPLGLAGKRLEYPGIAELLEVVPSTGEFVLRRDWVPSVESAKARGLVLGARLWTEQLLPGGRLTGLTRLPAIPPAGEAEDIAALFEKRCVAGDSALGRFLGAVVWAAP